jgi:hypothetical protein
MFNEMRCMMRLHDRLEFVWGMPHCIPFRQWVVLCIEEENSRGVDC